jgi:hypothetical protein
MEVARCHLGRVHGAERFSLARTFIVEVILFFIVIFCLVTILRVITGVIQVSSRGSWCGHNWSGGTSTAGGEGSARGDLSSPSGSTSRITPSPTSTK